MDDEEQVIGKGSRNLYPPSSQEALDYFNSCTIIPVHLHDGSITNVPFAQLDEHLLQVREEKRKRGRRHD
jgi:hypothetical protein